MNVLIINLTRFGDLIQTQPVISGFKSQGHRVGLVCVENFVSATTLIDGLDAVFPLKGAKLLSRLDTNWRLAVSEMSELADDVRKTFVPNLTVNLTPSISSRLLTRLMTLEEGGVSGFSVDELGFNADTTTWAAFLQMAGGNRGASPFNICDIFRRTAGLGDEGNSLQLARPAEDHLQWADEQLGEPAGEGFLAIQLGASEERRRWPIEHFARLARMARERYGLTPVLLGTKGEQPLGERFTAAVDFPVVNLMGRTSLAELAGVLTRCSALVTNDTGTMHLAAGLGVPVAAIFLATAQPWDTGPYRAGNICLEPDLPCHPCSFNKPCPNELACRFKVTPEVMAGALAILIADEPYQGDGARVWKSTIGSHGFMDLASLSGHDTTDRAIWIWIQRAHYLPFLDGMEGGGTTGLAVNMSSDMRVELSKILTTCREMLFLLSQQGMVLARNPRPQAKTKFLASWQRLQNVLANSDLLNILGSLWFFDSQMQGEDLGALLSMTARYHALFSSLAAEFEK